jgi:hypothetical protein
MNDNSDSDPEQEIDSLLDEIDYYEEPYDVETENRKLYIGCASYINSHLLFINKLSCNTFYKYNNEELSIYFYLTSCYRIDKNPSVEIIETIIEDDVYYAVIKTYYIKIIQRTWKRIFKEKKEQEKQISKNLLGFLDNRQRKRHCIEYIGLYGMLSNI